MHYTFAALDKVHNELGTGHIIRVSRVIDSLFESQRKDQNILVTLFSNNLDFVNKYDGIYVENFVSANKAMSEYINQYDVDVAFFDCLDYFSDIYQACVDRNIISICVDISEFSSTLPDLIINPVIQNKNSFLTGPHYSMHYESKVKKYISYNDRGNEIFVCFGGVDFQNYLSKLIPLIQNSLTDYKFNIVVSQPSDLENYKNISNNIQLYYKPDNFYDLLERSSLALISGGIILQEASYLGVPSIIFTQYDHQFEAAKKRKSEGSSLEVFRPDTSLKNIGSLIKKVMNQPPLLNQASLSGRSSDDGFGIKRITNILQIIEHLEWDSNFFNKNIYNITSKCFSNRIKHQLNQLTEDRLIDLVYFLCPAGDKRSIKNAIENGFIQVDQRLTYLVTAKNYKNLKSNFTPRINFSIKKSMPEDASELGALAKKIKWTTRYTNDENFDAKSIEKFYEEWVIKSIVGKLDDAVYHIRQNEEICGFISIKKMGINMGSIGLVGVSPDYQGKGIGVALSDFAVNYLINSMDCAAVQVVTQETNIGACKTYEKIGFIPSDHSIWLHKWIIKE